MTRIDAVIQGLPEDAGAAIVTGDYNRRYLTGLRSSAGTLLITRGGASLIIDSRYYELASSTVKDCEVILQDQLYEQIAGLLEKQGIKTVALDSGACTLKVLNSFREKLQGVTLLEDDRLGALLDRLRGRKSAQEMDKMRAAQKIVEQTLTHLLGLIKPGLTEKELALEAEFYGRKIGADGVSFSCIVAAGSNSSMPHAVPGETKVQSGELLLIDMGFIVDGYCSDMTRTLSIGKASPQQKDVYNTVLKAQQAAFEIIKPGTPCRDVDAAARELIDASPYQGLFGHGLGHSMGMEVHEPPAFNKISDAVLEQGMVLSVEPGIYLPGQFGVRIEDIIYVTENGFENLTGAPKHLIEL